GMRGAHDLAVSDATTSNHDLLGREGLEDLSVTINNLAIGRFQHTGKGGLDIVGQLVDDIVVTNFDALFLSLALSRTIGLDVKADNEGFRGGGKMNIGLADVTDTLVDQANLEVFLAKFGEGTFDGLSRALNIAFEHDIEFFGLTLLHVEGIEADLTERHRLIAALLGFILSTLTSSALVGDNLKAVAGLRNLG